MYSIEHLDHLGIMAASKLSILAISLAVPVPESTFTVLLLNDSCLWTTVIGVEQAAASPIGLFPSTTVARST